MENFISGFQHTIGTTKKILEMQFSCRIYVIYRMFLLIYLRKVFENANMPAFLELKVPLVCFRRWFAAFSLKNSSVYTNTVIYLVLE